MGLAIEPIGKDMVIHKRILIVDDQDGPRKTLKMTLLDSGYEVIGEGKTGKEAIELSKRLKPDLILMDVKMPEMDGIRAAKEINHRFPLPIIICTAKRDEATIKRAKEAGVMGYLIKPIREEELKATIELAISRFNEFEALRKEIKDLKEALEARKLIERAKGILTERQNLSEKDAFRRIQRLSMDKRKSMKEVAEAIIIAYEIGGDKDSKTL